MSSISALCQTQIDIRSGWRNTHKLSLVKCNASAGIKAPRMDDTNGSLD